jgi:hypothetical protein
LNNYEAHSTNSMADEIEKMAEALENRQFHLASICLGKIVDQVPLSAAEQTGEPEAFSTHFHAEGHKVVKAIDQQNYSLASLCLRKVVKACDEVSLPPGVRLKDPISAKATAERLVHALSSADLHMTADLSRKLARAFEFPAAVPPAAAPGDAPPDV